MPAKDYELIPQNVKAMALTRENVEEVAEWCNGTIVTEIDPLDSSITYPGINFAGVHGSTRLNLGYYIVQLENGKFDRKTAREFEHSYRETAKQIGSDIRENLSRVTGYVNQSTVDKAVITDTAMFEQIRQEAMAREAIGLKDVSRKALEGMPRSVFEQHQQEARERRPNIFGGTENPYGKR